MADFTSGTRGVNLIRNDPSGTPTVLTMGNVADGQVFQRSGTSIVGTAAAASPEFITDGTADTYVDTNADTNHAPPAATNAYGDTVLIRPDDIVFYENTSFSVYEQDDRVHEYRDHRCNPLVIPSSTSGVRNAFFITTNLQDFPKQPDNTTAARNTTWANRTISGFQHLLVKVAGSATAYHTIVRWAVTTAAQVHPTQLELDPASLVFGLDDVGASPAGIYSISVALAGGNIRVATTITNLSGVNDLTVCDWEHVFIGPQLA